LQALFSKLLRKRFVAGFRFRSCRFARRCIKSKRCQSVGARIRQKTPVRRPVQKNVLSKA
ncbi:MAG: hypothetical protein LUF77_05600, partial [Oscillospiraceae bacterium]|nr:hypothetical protein [Oscillospiraceae bacterium]